MFDYDRGLGPGRWLKWFMGVMVICGLLSFFPQSRVAVMLGSAAAAIGVAVIRYQIKKGGD